MEDVSLKFIQKDYGGDRQCWFIILLILSWGVKILFEEERAQEKGGNVFEIGH